MSDGDVNAQSSFRNVQSDYVLSSYSVELRIPYLNNLLDSKSYCKKTLTLKADFETVMRKDLFESKPDDLRLFLIKKDEAGRTQVHNLACPILGTAGSSYCFCPKRLAAGTIVSYIAQFQVLFNEVGKIEPCDSSKHLDKCNPAKSILLRRYVDALKIKQTMSHVSAKQAKPIFLDKLEKLSLHFSDLSSRTVLGIELFIYQTRLSLKFYFIQVIVLMIWRYVCLRR